MNIRKIIAATLFAACAPAFAGPVNINTATAKQLDHELIGVGPAIAQRIVDYREQHGAFSAGSELVAVKGIGERTLAKNAENIRIADAQ